MVIEKNLLLSDLFAVMFAVDGNREESITVGSVTITYLSFLSSGRGGRVG